MWYKWYNSNIIIDIDSAIHLFCYDTFRISDGFIEDRTKKIKWIF